MKKTLVLFLFVHFTLSLTSMRYAQSKEEKVALTGNLYSDSQILLTKFEGENIFAKYETSQKKSPIKAALFSLVVPGSGQFSNGDFWLSAVFIVAEAAFITTAVIYNNKGNSQTNFFQSYANQHWSVLRYAEWTLNNLTSLNSSLDASNYHVIVNGAVNWSELNRLETDIGDGYSHNLPIFGTQQYFELIGKYPQFSSGWDDFKASDFHDVSPEFLYYSDQRGEANNLYQVSARAVAAIYINHVVSALEAAWGATRFNNNLSMNMRINTLNLADRVEYIPTMNIIFSF